jgi:hypothetical protein
MSAVAGALAEEAAEREGETVGETKKKRGSNTGAARFDRFYGVDTFRIYSNVTQI